MPQLPHASHPRYRGIARSRVLPLAWACALFAAGCGDRSPSTGADPGPLQRATAPGAPSAGREKKNSPPLELTHQQIAARLGPHKIKCASTLITTAPRTGETRVEQEVTLRINREGHFEGTKNTHEQYGQQVIWTGDRLYTRLRHSKFSRRRPGPEEPRQLADRLVGLLPAYARLLHRFVLLKPGGKEQHLGREVIRVSLQQAPQPRQLRPASSVARRWRQTIKVTALSGTALLDAKTQVPLSVKLKARWTFSLPQGSPPAKTGIPTKINAGTTGSMDLQFSQEITAIGDNAPIAPPPPEEVMKNPNRVRLELERQMLTEELPLNKKNIRYPRAKKPAGRPSGAKK